MTQGCLDKALFQLGEDAFYALSRLKLYLKQLNVVNLVGVYLAARVDTVSLMVLCHSINSLSTHTVFFGHEGPAIIVLHSVFAIIMAQEICVL